MSASVYTAVPVGSTVVLPSNSKVATFSLIDVQGNDALGVFSTQKAIVTGWNLQENVNAQFTHTMGNDIYVNVFGNRMATLSVHGITFNAIREGVTCSDDPPGIDNIINWYQSNRVSNPNAPERIKITIGSTMVAEGFLINANYNARDPVSWTVEYTLQIAVIPK